MNYLAQYQQAMAEGNPEYARTICLSASEAIRQGVLTEEETAAFVAEVKANPPE
ncbi:hypothetical protein ACFYXS_02775 [Streptomyces sp. NPDC002574]|uniref:hypothetical protein n=1 Tax=Streptomyces sp. NPDC002574 TaxID=3364652 RepID=UPI0036C4E5A3